MKIKLEHISNTFNYGSLMMAVNTIKYITMHIDNVKFFADCASEQDLERLKKETQIDNIYIAEKYNIKTNNSKILKVMNEFRVAQVEGELYDLRIVLGGDDISEYYGKLWWIIQFPIMFVQSSKLKTIFLGQTIGPFTSYRRLLAKVTLNRAIIYTRDDKCLAYIKDMGIKNAKTGRDLAFLELPIEKEMISILNRYDLKRNQYITLVPSGLTKCYTKNYEMYIRNYCDIIQQLLQKKELIAKTIVLLPHVLLPTYVDDRNVIQDIKSKILLNEEDKKRLLIINDSMLASEARQILGNGLFTITGRMHAAVSTFYMRKPALSLSYSVKYEGVIGRGLDMNELVIECANEQLWETGKISAEVVGRVNYILNHYDEIIDKIERNVARTSEMSIKQLQSVVQDIKAIQQKRKDIDKE